MRKVYLALGLTAAAIALVVILNVVPGPASAPVVAEGTPVEGGAIEWTLIADEDCQREGHTADDLMRCPNPSWRPVDPPEGVQTDI